MDAPFAPPPRDDSGRKRAHSPLPPPRVRDDDRRLSLDPPQRRRYHSPPGGGDDYYDDRRASDPPRWASRDRFRGDRDRDRYFDRDVDHDRGRERGRDRDRDYGRGDRDRDRDRDRDYGRRDRDRSYRTPRGPLQPFEIPADAYDRPFMPYRPFAELADPRTPADEILAKYQAYKVEFLRRQALFQFEQFKREPWMMEKYHPESELPQELKEAADKRRDAFFEDLDRVPNLDNKGRPYTDPVVPDDEPVPPAEPEPAVPEPAEPEPAEPEPEAAEAEAAPKEDDADDNDNDARAREDPADEDEDNDARMDDAEEAGPGFRHKRGLQDITDPCGLFLRSVPRSVHRKDVLAVFKELPGFATFRMSDPALLRGMVRHAWIRFETPADAEAAVEKLKGVKIGDVYEIALSQQRVSTERPIKFTPPEAATPKRLAFDLEVTRKLIAKLDAEKGYTSNPLLEGDGDDDEDLTVNVRLDRNIAYLRTVHCFCYYSGRGFDEPELLLRFCGRCYARRPPPEEVAEEGAMDEQPDVSKSPWETSLDRVIELRLEADPAEKRIGVDQIEAKLEQWIKDNTEELEPERFRCKLCKKQFMAAHFVEKHIRTKHADEVAKRKETLLDEAFFSNYWSDPARINLSQVPGAKARPLATMPSGPVGPGALLPPPPMGMVPVPMPMAPVPGYGHPLPHHVPPIRAAPAYDSAMPLPPPQQRRQRYVDLDAPPEGEGGPGGRSLIAYDI